MKVQVSRFRTPVALVLMMVGLSLAASADVISFSTFVSSSSIGSAMSSTQVIGYTYAGNKFVGSLYPNDGRLYSTDLSGGSVQPFGVVPGAGGETVVAASLGQGGFASGNIFAGSGANGQLYQFGNGGGAASPFATLGCSPNCGVRSIFFDPGSSFGGNMLVTTTTGQIYRVSSGGVATQIANIGADTEGMDVLGSTFGPYTGWLLAASEGSAQLNVISPTGTVQLIGFVAGAETVAYVPTNLGSGNAALEGFYAANYPVDIVKAGPSEFTKIYSQFGRNLLGDAIVTSETGHGIFDIHWNGSGFDAPAFIGNYPDQPEDGIFVTAQRIQEVGAPEPASMITMATGLAGLVGALRRKLLR